MKDNNTKTDCSDISGYKEVSLYFNYSITMFLDLIIVSLFGFFGSDYKSSWKMLGECLCSLNQFNVLAALCMAYQVFSAGLIWENGQYSGFLSFIWGIKWIIEGISNTVPGLLLHHKDFTFGQSSLYPHLLFIIFLEKWHHFY